MENTVQPSVQNDASFRNRYAMSWKSISDSTECYPEHEDESIQCIKDNLGHLPDCLIFMQHLPAINTLLEAKKRGSVSQQNFEHEVLFYLKAVRNDDMKKGNWVAHKEHTKSDYEQYAGYLPQFTSASRERLSRIIGYEPMLIYSLEAEVYLRQLFAEDTYYRNSALTSLDYKAATILFYRHLYITEGEFAADASNLPAKYLNQL